MDIKKEAVRKYLEDGIAYRELSKKYGVSRTTINNWVLVCVGFPFLKPDNVINHLLKINYTSANNCVKFNYI
ncbi:MAG: helix-turn-helix domain-containing protein [Niastella sp.]|nr:helix-turn-helix domain-containing protein [Niastella sp.]